MHLNDCVSAVNDLSSDRMLLLATVPCPWGGGICNNGGRGSSGRGRDTGL
jgi:hypothetical protein